MVMATLPGDLTVTVTRAAAKDAFGDPTGAPGVVPHTVDGCLLAPGGSAETQNRADTVATDWDLYAPVGADIVATDQVEVPGIGFPVEVHGDPKVWPDAGLVVALRRVAG